MDNFAEVSPGYLAGDRLAKVSVCTLVALGIIFLPPCDPDCWAHHSRHSIIIGGHQGENQDLSDTSQIIPA
jgi:hypothetical protein